MSRQISIPVDDIIALTPQGKPVKFQTLQTEVSSLVLSESTTSPPLHVRIEQKIDSLIEYAARSANTYTSIKKELYVYDIRIGQAASSSDGSPPPSGAEIPLPKRYSVSNPPNNLRDQRSLQSWQELFKARRTWALKVADDCGLLARAAQDRYAEMDVMMRCLDAAVANLEAVVRGIEPKYAETKKWAGSAQVEYNTLVNGWERYLGLARSVPISPAMLLFMANHNVNVVGSGQQAGLSR